MTNIALEQPEIPPPEGPWDPGADTEEIPKIPSEQPSPAEPTPENRFKRAVNVLTNLGRRAVHAVLDGIDSFVEGGSDMMAVDGVANAPFLDKAFRRQNPTLAQLWKLPEERLLASERRGDPFVSEEVHADEPTALQPVYIDPLEKFEVGVLAGAGQVMSRPEVLASLQSRRAA